MALNERTYEDSIGVGVVVESVHGADLAESCLDREGRYLETRSRGAEVIDRTIEGGDDSWFVVVVGDVAKQEAGRVQFRLALAEGVGSRDTSAADRATATGRSVGHVLGQAIGVRALRRWHP